jgi:ADP-ribose pyrophosphatase YjhB (NUDIX family)
MLGVARISARAILIDDQDQLVLIRRTRPGRETYWTTAGGGVEETDLSVEAAMHREIAEELGAIATAGPRVFLVSRHTERGLTVQHYFLARLLSLDPAIRNGPEFLDPARGAYDVERVDLHSGALSRLDLWPHELKEFILANREALVHEAHTLR